MYREAITIAIIVPDEDGNLKIKQIEEFIDSKSHLDCGGSQEGTTQGSGTYTARRNRIQPRLMEALQALKVGAAVVMVRLAGTRCRRLSRTASRSSSVTDKSQLRTSMNSRSILPMSRLPNVFETMAKCMFFRVESLAYLEATMRGPRKTR